MNTLNSSSASVWWSPVTAHPPGRSASLLGVPAQIERGPVPAQPRVPGVRPGQQEGGEELPEPRDHRHVHRARDGPGHQAGRRGGRHHVGHVPGEEDGDGRDDEPPVPAADLLEGGAALHLQVDRRRPGPVRRPAPRGWTGTAVRGRTRAVQLAPAGGQRVVPGVVEPHRSGVGPVAASPPNSPCPRAVRPRAQGWTEREDPGLFSRRSSPHQVTPSRVAARVLPDRRSARPGRGRAARPWRTGC